LRFLLKDFSGARDDLAIEAEVFKIEERIRLSFKINSPDSKVVLAHNTSLLKQKEGLWEETCFEFFARVPGEEQYWEWNFSPYGYWNQYHFEQYRSIPKKLTTPPVSLMVQKQFFSIEFPLPIEKKEWLIAPTAIIKEEKGPSYWAQTHPKEEPDFHNFDNFIPYVQT
jgi:hypothetical protein